MTNQENRNSLSHSFTPAGRLGFHYFPDTLHYTERDLQLWLPILVKLGANWLVIRSDTGRAIPESFITSLKQAGINPFIQFNLPLGKPPAMEEVSPLIESYIHWGAMHIQVFDRPNLRSSWPAGSWAQQDLVERFLDRFLPLADLVARANAVPVMPAFEPGGDYWDTAFLRNALQSIERRGMSNVLSKLALGAYAWTFRRSIDWGAGGPEYWPDTRPYFTPSSSQDQRGFRIYQWYQAVAAAVLQRPCPVFLLQAGLPAHPDRIKPDELATGEHAAVIKELYTWVTGKELVSEKGVEALPPPQLDMPEEVEACNFWLLSADKNSPYREQSWFHEGHPRLPHTQSIAKNITPPAADAFVNPTISNDTVFKRIQHPITHYILLANSQHGNWETQLARLLPFINQNHPTIGFSIEEAALAGKVTIVGKSPYITADTLARLTRTGCQVEQIGDDGTNLAM